MHRLDLLESALDRPKNAAAYEGADLVTQAATLMWGLVRNHPFSDGNKRTALVVTRVFLEMNGQSLVMSHDDKFELVVSVANRKASVEQVADVLRSRIVPKTR